MSNGNIPRYWGIYFPKDDAWLKRSDGDFFYWPSPYIAQAQLKEMRRWPGHDGVKVREFDYTILSQRRELWEFEASNPNTERL